VSDEHSQRTPYEEIPADYWKARAAHDEARRTGLLYASVFMLVGGVVAAYIWGQYPGSSEFWRAAWSMTGFFAVAFPGLFIGIVMKHVKLAKELEQYGLIDDE
jgi:uncharacterized membrane protein YhdT